MILIVIRDLRQNRQRWQNAENNDDITALDFHPTRDNILLGGDDGGLVSLFDTSIAEEDESLIQAFNHGPIHRAGFASDDVIHALSSDQSLALHPVDHGGEQEDHPPVILGDVRPVIPCEYVIDIVRTGQNVAIAAGSHRSR